MAKLFNDSKIHVSLILGIRDFRMETFGPKFPIEAGDSTSLSNFGGDIFHSPMIAS